jgi:hypothetical protein
VEGSRFRVDGVPHGAVEVSAVSGAQIDAVQLEVAPPGARVTLHARPTFKVAGEFVDESGAPLEGGCQAGIGPRPSVRGTVAMADANGHFVAEAPVGPDTVLTCFSAKGRAEQILPRDAVPGTTIELKMVAKKPS